MGLFFGTDGVRGVVNKGLTKEIAYKIGNALSTLKVKPKIIIGRDTRVSGSYFTLAVAVGAMSGGADVLNVGIVPTAGIAYLTKELEADYGVVISASHNSAEYNGIKVYDKNGYKLGEKEEENIERCFLSEKINFYPNIGSYFEDYNLVKKYKRFLINSSGHKLNGLKIVLDCANGASHKIAPEVFRRLGASVVSTNSFNDGKRINDNCGALYPDTLRKNIFRYKADMGFAFDGDADRLIMVDEKGCIQDGDKIICALAKYYKSINRLNDNTVVGTSHTNMGIEEDLKANGIKMLRTDIGDKYVLAKLVEKNLSLGGEQSGHIIIKDLHTTGDGILSAIVFANMCINKNITASKALDVKLYPQTNLNIVVNDKLRIMNSERLSGLVAKYNVELNGKGRIMVRASGTEPKIRIMVESANAEENQFIASQIEKTVREIDGEN